MWGIGVHPGLPQEITAFDAVGFATALEDALFVGEVGLDGKSKAPIAKQRAVFDQVLDAVAGGLARPLSTASPRRGKCWTLSRPPDRGSDSALVARQRERDAGGCRDGLFLLGQRRRGSASEGSALLPQNRVLTETDFPYSRRSDPVADRPAAVATIEVRLMQEWGVQTSSGFGAGCGAISQRCYERCELSERLPETVQDAMLTAGMD